MSYFTSLSYSYFDVQFITMDSEMKQKRIIGTSALDASHRLDEEHVDIWNVERVTSDVPVDVQLQQAMIDEAKHEEIKAFEAERRKGALPYGDDELPF